MATVKVKFRPSTVPGKAGAVVYQLIHRRKMRLVSTGIRLSVSQWEVLPEATSGKLAAVRRQLGSGQAVLQRIVSAFDKSGREYTVDEVVRRYKSGRDGKSFLDFMRREIDGLTQAGKLGTARNYRSTLNSFSTFLQYRDAYPSFLVDNVVEEYGNWLSSRELSRNTVSFYMRMLRAVYNKAVNRRQVEQSFPFRNVYTGVAPTRKRAVGEDIIARLVHADLPRYPALSFARDLFVFSYCMRGMAFVDMAYLKKADIMDGFICYHRRKTGQQLQVRLERFAFDIVKKYAGSYPDTSYLFPILKSERGADAYRQYQTALRYYNRLLKQLSAKLRLGVPLSSYVARHSWATAARNHHIPLSVISAGMGHTSEKTTRIYLASLENTVIDDANREIIGSLNRPVSG